MILVFAGQENSPVLLGIHHLIGTADDLSDARHGFALWQQQQLEEWRTTLATKHPTEQYGHGYVQGILNKTRFWYQFVERRLGQDPEYVIVDAGKTYGN